MSLTYMKDELLSFKLLRNEVHLFMKFTIKKTFLLAKVDEKAKVNLYTLLDVETFDKVIVIGTKDTDVVEKDTVQAEISFSLTNEKLILSTGETRYVDVAQKFVTSIGKVK